MATTGELIQAARISAGFSQNQLGQKLGVTGSLVSHWEADRRPVADMSALASVLGTSEKALTGDAPTRPCNKREDRPPLAAISTEMGEPYIGIGQACRVLSGMLSRKVCSPSVHQWVATMGLPAYENPLRKNPLGDPTLAFRRSELVAWVASTLQPVKAVNQ